VKPGAMAGFGVAVHVGLGAPAGGGGDGMTVTAGVGGRGVGVGVGLGVCGSVGALVGTGIGVSVGVDGAIAFVDVGGAVVGGVVAAVSCAAAVETCGGAEVGLVVAAGAVPTRSPHANVKHPTRIHVARAVRLPTLLQSLARLASLMVEGLAASLEARSYVRGVRPVA